MKKKTLAAEDAPRVFSCFLAGWFAWLGKVTELGKAQDHDLWSILCGGCVRMEGHWFGGVSADIDGFLKRLLVWEMGWGQWGRVCGS